MSKIDKGMNSVVMNSVVSLIFVIFMLPMKLNTNEPVIPEDLL